DADEAAAWAGRPPETRARRRPLVCGRAERGRTAPANARLAEASCEGASWPVSRVLSGGTPSATAIHLGLGSLPASSNQPGRRPGSRLVAGVASAPVPPLFGLAPGGVCRAASVAGDAVRSYRTLSPLPAEVALRRRFAFCGTFPGVAPGGR